MSHKKVKPEREFFALSAIQRQARKIHALTRKLFYLALICALHAARILFTLSLPGPPV
jgi:hypothetical protein